MDTAIATRVHAVEPFPVARRTQNANSVRGNSSHPAAAHTAAAINGRTGSCEARRSVPQRRAKPPVSHVTPLHAPARAAAASRPGPRRFRRNIWGVRLSVIIPVYNEEQTIDEVIDRVAAVRLDGIEKEIVIANDGSTDSTRRIIDAR